MALFCLDCFNKIKGTNYTYEDVIYSMDFCEKCGENTDCIIAVKKDVNENF